MKKIVGKVSREERDEIESIFERQNGLNELAKLIKVENTDMYEKLVKDLGVTQSRFQRWWNAMASKYQWDGTENGHWEINFDTCEIFLVTPD